MISMQLLMTKIKEKLLLITYFIIIAFGGVFFNFSYLVSTLFFFVVPSLYITLKHPKLFKPLLIYALSIGIPFVLIIDTLALYNHAWWETSVFSYRFFDLLPFDTVLWAVLYSYTIPILYEYFFGKRESVTLNKKFSKFSIGLFIALILFLITFSINPMLFTIPYFYAFFVGIFYFLVCVIGLFQYPKEFSRLLLQCFFFSIPLFIGELGSLAAYQWGFSGNEYLGIIHIGNLSFPFEEMIWILIGVPAFVHVYLRLTKFSD